MGFVELCISCFEIYSTGDMFLVCAAGYLLLAALPAEFFLALIGTLMHVSERPKIHRHKEYRRTITGRLILLSPIKSSWNKNCIWVICQSLLNQVFQGYRFLALCGLKNSQLQDLFMLCFVCCG